METHLRCDARMPTTVSPCAGAPRFQQHLRRPLPGLKPRSSVWPWRSTQFHRWGQLLLLISFWKFTFNFSGFSLLQGALVLIKAALSDGKSRGSQVGWTHPRLRWVWQMLGGESSLWLILFLISSQLPGAPGGGSGGAADRGTSWKGSAKADVAPPKAHGLQSFAAVHWKRYRTWSRETQVQVSGPPRTAEPLCLGQTQFIPSRAFRPASPPSRGCSSSLLLANLTADNSCAVRAQGKRKTYFCPSPGLALLSQAPELPSASGVPGFTLCPGPSERF